MSSLENALNYITHHVESIIQWLFLATLLLGSYPIYRWVFGKRGEDGPVTAASAASVTLADGGDIQVFLKKILDQTTKLETMPMAAMTPSAAGEIEAQIQVMKKELAARDEELGKLKSGGDKKPSADADGLTTRIKELESKLAEYEILEDDIADLSLYKEENQRLKAELDKSKAAGVGTASAVPPLTSPAKDEDIVAEFANAVGQKAAAESKPKSMEIKETGDPMADFESAVALEKKMTGGEPGMPAPLPEAAPFLTPPKPPPPAERADPAAPAKEGDDLFAEFAAPPAGADEGGSLDTDKMMAEMAALVDRSDGAAAGSGLEETSDIEKMALEATGLTKS